MQTLLLEIRTLALQYQDVENRIINMESQSNLLANPLGWAYAISNQDELYALRDGLARQIYAKKDLYNILILTSQNQNCQ